MIMTLCEGIREGAEWWSEKGMQRLKVMERIMTKSLNLHKKKLYVIDINNNIP